MTDPRIKREHHTRGNAVIGGALPTTAMLHAAMHKAGMQQPTHAERQADLQAAFATKTVADTIFDQYRQATQDADEIWGLGDDIPGYIHLMERIIADAQDRIAQAKANA